MLSGLLTWPGLFEVFQAVVLLTGFSFAEIMCKFDILLFLRFQSSISTLFLYILHLFVLIKS